MTRKADFNAEEWSTLMEGPLLAGMRVLTAARGGLIRESLAMGEFYARAHQTHGEGGLLDDLVASPPTLDPSRLPVDAELGAAMTKRLGEALGVLERKATPEELATYKRFVISIGEAVADGHREGGVLGIGGERVSEPERQALDQIRAVLQLS